ncbi:MAG TPA: Hint domain-containing protein, partial [Armatimonadota bacterium]
MNWGQVGLSGVTGGVGGVVGKVAADAIGSAAADAMEKLIPGTCFAAGTPVQTADGSTRPIEEVKAGDWVWGRDEVSGQAQAHQVRQTIQREAPATLTLAFDGGQTLTTTPEHPFWAVGRGWSPARELGIGTSIVT